MTEQDTRNELIEELKDLGIVLDADYDDTLLIKFEELCRAYRSSPMEIATEWVAFSANKNIESKPTLEKLSQFEREGLHKKLSKTPLRNVMKKTTTPRSQARSYKNESFNSMMQYDTPVKPSSHKRQLNPETPPTMKSPGFSPSISSTRYETRTSKGDVACRWGETATCTWTSNDARSVSVQNYDSESTLTTRYQFMFEKIRDRANILNDILEDAASLYKDKYQVDEWNNFCLPSPIELTVVGRICGDGGKLNSSSIILEGSIETCSGQTIPLDVSKLSHYAFFPGQIISGQGKNLLGKALLMSSLYEPVYLKFPQQMLASEADNLQIVVAAGPFTTADNLYYEPLTDLMKYIVENRPQVCILIGPLIDSRNENLEKNLTEDVDDIYKRLLLTIENTRKESSTHFIVVSSYNDISHDYIYPTPPFVFKEFNKLQFVSDPSVLSIDGVVIGLTSTDVMFHLSKEETASPGAADRLGRLAQHILMQRSFYPLYPPHEDINIDYGHFEIFARLPVMPHILILPSELHCFIKNIRGCCCINPERLTKGVSGGNFARIQVDLNGCKSTYNGSIVDYIKSEIVKI